MLNIEIKGLSDLEKALMQLPTEVAQKELTNALAAGGEVIAEEMASQAPRGTDIGPRKKEDQHLADSIVVQRENKVIGSAAEVYVGPNGKVAWRARFVEFGTTAHAIIARRKKILTDGGTVFGKHADHPGEKPFPFMRSSLSAAAKDALEEIRKTLAEGIQRAAKRIKRASAQQ